MRLKPRTPGRSGVKRRASSVQPPAMEYEPVYVTYDELHADRIRGILAGQGMDCAVRSLRVGGYEGIRLGPLGEIRILVPAPYASKARRLIQEAIQDGVLWRLGAPLGGPGEHPEA